MKDNYTVSYWQKEDCGSWQQITTLNRRGKNVVQRYINGILQEPMRVLNKKYWPYQFQYISNKHDEYDLERWCYDNLKSANWRNYRKLFAFKREADAAMFALRWT